MIPTGSIIEFTYIPTVLPTVLKLLPFYVIAKIISYLPNSSFKFMTIYSYEGFPVGIHTIITQLDTVTLYDNETEFFNTNPEYAI